MKHKLHILLNFFVNKLILLGKYFPKRLKQNFIYKNIVNIIINYRNYINHKFLFQNSTKIKTLLDFDKSIFAYQNLIISKLNSIKSSKNPLISIIIPSYGQIKYSINCLLSISKFPPNYPFEIIFINDAYPYSSSKYNDFIKKIKTIKFLNFKNNKGFIDSCNFASKKAKGRYLYFLNNDTQLTNQSIDKLVETFNRKNDAGIVGSKLLFEDSLLQEAGGIVWNTGQIWNFGRNADANEPEYNYLRSVDYVSGSSLMIKSDVFKSLDGFDTIFKPMYCEDVDLAFRVKKLGYKIYYQPLSIIYHFEGKTSGNDISKGYKKFQVDNITKLQKRWSKSISKLGKEGLAIPENINRGRKKSILYIDNDLPRYDRDAGSMSQFNRLKVLYDLGYHVTFLPNNLLFEELYCNELQSYGIECLYFTPRLYSFKKILEDNIDKFDYVFICRPESYVKTKPFLKKLKKTKIIYDFVDLHFLRMRREQELGYNISNDEINRIQKIELEAIRKCHASFLISSSEKKYLLKNKLINKYDKDVFVIPLIVSVNDIKCSYERSKDFFFVGNYNHSPNVDAVKYILENILPIINEHNKAINFHIIGPNLDKKIISNYSNVIYHGYVEKLELMISKLRVNLSYLRFGAGQKGKVLFSLMVGCPVITTKIGAESLGLKNNEDIIIVDSKEEAANKLLSLYNDKALWEQLSKNGILKASSNNGPNKNKKELKKLLTFVDTL